MPKIDVYNVYCELFQNKRDNSINLLVNAIETHDIETVILAAVDATLKTFDVDLYIILVEEFCVQPSTFQLRVKEDTIDEYRLFMRQIRLRNILNE